MITFYRTKDCTACADVEDIMEELVLRHKDVVVKDKSELPEEVKGSPLPLMVDDNERISGLHNIVEHLDEVAQFKRLWEKYQDDACYCDEDPGETGGPSYDL
jgi:hypothetical protein